MGHLEIIGDDRFRDYEWLEIHNKKIKIPPPTEIPKIAIVELEREKIIEMAMAAWTKSNGRPSMHFRLCGPPGVGKNTIVYGLAQILKKDLYIFNGSDDLRADEVGCPPSPNNDNGFDYQASPLFAALLRGGICLFDEIDKVPEKSLSKLSSVLDDRRTLDVGQLDLQLKANKDFLFCAITNGDETLEDGLPGYIDERLRPVIFVNNPSPRAMEAILRSHLPEAENIWVEVFLEEYRNENISPRIANRLLELAYKLSEDDRGKTRKDNKRSLGKDEVRDYLHKVEPGFIKRKADPIGDLNKSKTKKERERYVEDLRLFNQKGETIH